MRTMLRLVFVIIMVVSIIFTVCPFAVSADEPPAYTKSWDGEGDNVSWDDPTNWNPDGIPGSSDTVYIGPQYSVKARNCEIVVNWIHCDGSFQMGGGSFQTSGDSIFEKGLSILRTILGTGYGLGTIYGPGTIIGDIYSDGGAIFRDNLNIVGSVYLTSGASSKYFAIYDKLNVTGRFKLQVAALDLFGELNCPYVDFNDSSGKKITFMVNGVSPNQYGHINGNFIVYLQSKISVLMDYVPVPGDTIVLVNGQVHIHYPEGPPEGLPGGPLDDGFVWETIVHPDKMAIEVIGPQISSLNPASIQANGSDFNLSINGRGFANSVAYWHDQNGIVALSTTVLFLDRLSATVPANLISSAKTAEIYVINSDVRNSDPFPFFVTATDATVTASTAATSGNPAGTATASVGDSDPVTPDSLAATATGAGTVAVAQYASNPGTVPCFMSTGSYFDVYTSLDSAFESIDVVVNMLNGGDTVYWWNGTEWVLVSNQTYDSEAMTVTFNINDSSVPNLSDLHGSIFGVSQATTQINPIIIDPAIPAPVGTNVHLSGSFTGTNPGQYTVSVDWGDLSSPTEIQTTQPGLINASHNYTTSGVYTITAQVTDLNNTTSSATYQYAVIYDPNNGFVTGGGWIDSPAGAYTHDPTLSGKATFGFVSRYQKGKNLPVGNTEFQFQTAGLSFKSTSYDWLVVAGSKAQYKGTGTINSAGEYGFMLTAKDGTQDMFRIKIWDKATGNIIYDNLMSEDDYVDPTTIIGGGSIVIHKA
jgi:hypothetical protein